MITGDTRLSLAGQKTLLNEWVANTHSDQIASREAMQPAQFITELAYISIMEKVDADVYFRFSGSEIRRMLGREAKGHRLVQFPRLANSKSGIPAVRSAFRNTQPVSGTEELPGNIVHFWLRLPVMDKDGKVTQLICHDRLLEHSMLEVEAPEYELRRRVNKAA
ncbi:PAS domain-containing protein [Hirschia baltica]|uniref:PAS domain-containing protein n=1 Tax=Hirschia baltica (strain ATCC 49814 / DSM 5838 / IFAM 1418) TaxID=582402 RepID=C6XI95_HIRBI|nr:PAS domain-containing protein [Hirschia baltica]ACT58921.1 hypothetical protein Hbal_1229 [Hirschia baltica ATCC 49814]